MADKWSQYAWPAPGKMRDWSQYDYVPAPDEVPIKPQRGEWYGRPSGGVLFLGLAGLCLLWGAVRLWLAWMFEVTLPSSFSVRVTDPPLIPAILSDSPREPMPPPLANGYTSE